MSMATDPDFAAALLAAARPHEIATNPFVAAVTSGRSSRDAVRAWAEVLFATAIRFPNVLARVLSLCDHPAVRAHLLANLLEEEGVAAYRAGERVVVDASRNHGMMARRFALAAGATEETLDAPDPRVPRWFDDALNRRDWAGALAFVAVGFEANIPETFRLVHPALRAHYGFDEDGLEFLTEHMTADERHGRESAELLASLPDSEQRERALHGARRGGLAWWTLHRHLARN